MRNPSLLFASRDNNDTGAESENIQGSSLVSLLLGGGSSKRKEEGHQPGWYGGVEIVFTA